MPCAVYKGTCESKHTSVQLRAKFHIDFQLISCEPAWSGASSISACSQSFNALAKDGKMAL